MCDVISKLISSGKRNFMGASACKYPASFQKGIQHLTIRNNFTPLYIADAHQVVSVVTNKGLFSAFE